MTKETQPNQKKKPNETWHNINTEPLQSITLSQKQLESLEKERNKAFWAKADNQTVDKGRVKAQN